MRPPWTLDEETFSSLPLLAVGRGEIRADGPVHVIEEILPLVCC